MSRQSVGGLRTARHGAVDVLAGREGDQSSALTTSIRCRCSPVPLSLSLVLSQAPLAGSGRVKSGVSHRSKEEFSGRGDSLVSKAG